MKRVRTVMFLRKHATGIAPTELHTVHVERGMSWPEALEKFSELLRENEGMCRLVRRITKKFHEIAAHY